MTDQPCANCGCFKSRREALAMHILPNVAAAIVPIVVASFMILPRLEARMDALDQHLDQLSAAFEKVSERLRVVEIDQAERRGREGQSQ